MKKYFWMISLTILFSLAFSACKTTPVEEQPAVVIEQSPMEESDTEIDDSTQADEPVDEPEQPASNIPAWYSTPLTDVNTGAVFTVEQNLGKVILVETLATWCSNCLKQQNEVVKFHEQLGERDDFISLGIDIDPNEDIPLLTGYVKKHGFDWLYVVASGEMIDEINRLYGPQYLNPPSTPMLIIDRSGNSHQLGFGIKSAEKLLEEVTPYF